MQNNPLNASNVRSLAGLMKLSPTDRADWSADDLAAILRHQLAAPLEYDLRTIVSGGEKTISDMTARIATGPRPRTFADLIAHPHPPIDLLGLMKDFSRKGRDDGSLPAEVGTALYYAAIVLGIVRQKTRLTSLDDAALRKGLEWSVSLPWIDIGLKQLFSNGISALSDARS